MEQLKVFISLTALSLHHLETLQIRFSLYVLCSPTSILPYACNVCIMSIFVTLLHHFSVVCSNLAYVEEMQVRVLCSHQSKTLVLECASFANCGLVLCTVQLFLNRWKYRSHTNGIHPQQCIAAAEHDGDTCVLVLDKCLRQPVHSKRDNHHRLLLASFYT